MKRDLNHGDRTSPAERANRLSDCGTSADRSTTTRPLGERFRCTPCGVRPTAEMLAARTGNNSDPAQVNDFATATILPSVRLPSIIGASVATYARVSSAADDPSPVTRGRAL